MSAATLPCFEVDVPWLPIARDLGRVSDPMRPEICPVSACWDDARMVLVWPSGAAQGDTGFYSAVSSDGGQSWDTQFTASDFVVMPHVMSHHGRFILFAFAGIKFADGPQGGYLTKDSVRRTIWVSDDAMRWDKVVIARADGDYDELCLPSDPVLSDGSLFLPDYYWGFHGAYKYAPVIAARTLDAGRTWTKNKETGWFEFVPWHMIRKQIYRWPAEYYTHNPVADGLCIYMPYTFYAGKERILGCELRYTRERTEAPGYWGKATRVIWFGQEQDALLYAFLQEGKLHIVCASGAVWKWTGEHNYNSYEQSIEAYKTKWEAVPELHMPDAKHMLWPIFTPFGLVRVYVHDEPLVPVEFPPQKHMIRRIVTQPLAGSKQMFWRGFRSSKEVSLP